MLTASGSATMRNTKVKRGPGLSHSSMRRAPTVTLQSTALTERSPAPHGCYTRTSDTLPEPPSKHLFHLEPRSCRQNTNDRHEATHGSRNTSCPPPLGFHDLKASHVDSVIRQTTGSPPVTTHEIGQRLKVLG